MKIVVICSVILGFSMPAAALSGNDALNWHRSSEGTPSAPLLAYLRGTIDSELVVVELLRRRAAESPEYQLVWKQVAPELFCPPSGVVPRQAYDLLIKWLEAIPEKRQLELAVHTRVALRMAWRCTE